MRNGDLIEVDARAAPYLDVSDASSRSVAPTETGAEADWYKLYVDHVQQAHLGADLDVLVGGSGADVKRDSH